MFTFIADLLNSIFKILLTSRKDLIFTLVTLKKENQIYKRQLNHKKAHNSLKRRDRLFLTLIFELSRKATNHLILVQPSTLIFDNAQQFPSIDYSWYEIEGVNISVAAPKAGQKQVFCSPMRRV
jgi:hypothetical protein